MGTGEMAERVRAFDWGSTAIGAVSEWTDTLLGAVNMMLCASHPILLLCGPELILLYNDAFRPILSDRHPEALGDRGKRPTSATTTALFLSLMAGSPASSPSARI